MKQIRIYYESIEQGYDYIRPAVESACDKNTEVVFVRRPKKASDLIPGSISAILTMTTPDALITGVDNGKEYPLVLIEFTEAVTTEDHELQRTYGAIAAYLSGCYYLKLAGEKQSEKEFGGADYNPYSTPRIFIDKVKYEGYIIANWDTEAGNSYTLQRNEKLPSCPPRIAIFESTIKAAVKAFVENPTSWYSQSLDILKKDSDYKAYRKLVDKATGAKELLTSWAGRRDSNLNKLRYFVRKDFVAAKINRFGHAMDPDRGILTFISFLFSEETTVYGIYALVRARGNDLMKKDMDGVDSMQVKLGEAFKHDKGGIPKWLENEIVRAAKNAKSLDEVIDFQPVFEKHKKEILENKVVMTLAFFLDGIKLNYNGITLKWDKRKLLGVKKGEGFLSAYARSFNFGIIASPTPLSLISNEVDEDEVTYAIVHRVLIPNGFKIVSVSYPGAQGGNAILPYPEHGKSQERIYVDTIAMPPAAADFDVVLNESKGMFNEREVMSDVQKILLFKSSQAHKAALKETLLVARVIDARKQIRNIVVGVSFGLRAGTNTQWRPDAVDFIFRIVDRKRWAIGIFKQSLHDFIHCIEGTTDFPKVYEVNLAEDELFS